MRSRQPCAYAAPPSTAPTQGSIHRVRRSRRSPASAAARQRQVQAGLELYDPGYCEEYRQALPNAGNPDRPGGVRQRLALRRLPAFDHSVFCNRRQADRRRDDPRLLTQVFGSYREPGLELRRRAEPKRPYKGKPPRLYWPKNPARRSIRTARVRQERMLVTPCRWRWSRRPWRMAAVLMQPPPRRRGARTQWEARDSDDRRTRSDRAISTHDRPGADADDGAVVTAHRHRRADSGVPSPVRPGTAADWNPRTVRRLVHRLRAADKQKSRSRCDRERRRLRRQVAATIAKALMEANPGRKSNT